MTHARTVTSELLALIPASLLGLAVLPTAGCDVSEEVIGETASATTCPLWACGTNSAVINNISIGELHQHPDQNTGYANSSGARLVGFTGPNGETDMIIDMSDGTLRARQNGTVLRGNDLVGSVIHIDDGQGEVVDVTINRYRQVNSWTSPAFLVDHYILVAWDSHLNKEMPICTDAADSSMDSAWAVIASSERYSWSAKTVIASGNQGLGWNTISCHGNSLYKMKMTGYEAGAQHNNPNSSNKGQRQATLKMFTGDYCGTGESFTEDGTDLRWYNTAGWADNDDGTETAFEAYWNKHGALCLDTARLGADQLDAIAAECATVGKVLGPCSEYTGNYVWASEVPL